MNALFFNQPVGKEVTVDLDVWFWSFIRPYDEVPDGCKPGFTLTSIRKRLERLEDKVGLRIKSYYRRSSNGHVHVKLVFKNEVAVLDAFMIRAWMLDDKQRLELDLARYLITSSLHEMNRCFDEKATDTGGIKQSGPWIDIDIDRKDFSGEIREDWLQHLRQFKEMTNPEEQNGQTQL